LDWHDYSEDSWQLRQLPEILAGVKRVVWTIVPVLGSDVTQRDGQGNTACAALAGFAFAHGLELAVLRAGAARDVADVAGVGKVFLAGEPAADGRRRVERVRIGPGSARVQSAREKAPEEESRCRRFVFCFSQRTRRT
jgi:hypothetical protein